MKRSTCFFAAALSLMSSTLAQAGSVTQLAISGSGGLSGLGSYTGQISYDNAGLLDISLTNTSSPANGGYITGFVFNIHGNANATYQPIGGDTFANTNSESAAPFGTFEEGAAIGGNFLGGGNPNSGIAVGASRTFRFNLAGAAVASLTANSFFSQLVGGEALIVRFKGFNNGGSDKVPATDTTPCDPAEVIPTPAAAGAGLALLSLMGLRRRRD